MILLLLWYLTTVISTAQKISLSDYSSLFTTDKSKNKNKYILMHHEKIASTFLKKCEDKKRKDKNLAVSKEKYVDIS